MIGEVLGSQGDRHPKLVVWIREMKSRRHDADDGIALAIEQNGCAQNLRIRAKAALPQTVAHHHDMLASGLVVLCCKDAANGGIQLQNGEQACGNLLAFDAYRLTLSGEIETAVAVGSHVFENGTLIFPVGEIAR